MLQKLTERNAAVTFSSGKFTRNNEDISPLELHWRGFRVQAPRGSNVFKADKVTQYTRVSSVGQRVLQHVQDVCLDFDMPNIILNTVV